MVSSCNKKQIRVPNHIKRYIEISLSSVAIVETVRPWS